MRYLNQRFTSPNDKVTGILTDIGTEELAHLEIVGAILYQLTKDLTPDEIAGSPFATYFVDHTTGVYPVSAAGVPFDIKYIASKGDIITDLNEDLAADAAITKEQPLREKSRKSLKYKDFSHLGKTPGNRIPAFP